ncbi:MAG: DUF4347 domain-containing protein [Polyangiaceae bacterium]|nr:DUF4347 domain-containing protein [Polyangiaceae bacterium]
MTIHILVVGHRPRGHKMPNDSEIDAIAALVAQHAPSKSQVFFVRSCESPDKLVRIVREIAAKHGLIDTLDLYDHGAGGFLQMGDALLFGRDDATDLAIAEQLRPLLTKGARLRLLGCDTATGAAGRKLLTKLHAAFGGDVTVLGTIASITLSQFDELGFRRKHFEELYLYSSWEAIRDEQANRRPPTFDERDDALIAWGRAQRQLLGQA